MSVGNWGHELAELRAENEREAGIAAARHSLKRQGLLICKVCENEIEAERRAAMPSAWRCIGCQEEHEQWQAKRNRY